MQDLLYYNLYMNNQASQQSRPWVRGAIYAFMTLCVVTIVTILVLVVLGYSFNQKEGTLTQGGLLQFASKPTGASVLINEAPHTSRTNTKATVAAGHYSVQFDRVGYKPWRKSIEIAPGQIGWINYARLIPEKLTAEPLREFESVTGALTSPKRNWMLLQLAADKPLFELANLQGDTVRYTTLTIPEQSFTTPTTDAPQQFSIEAWSDDESAILLKHTFDTDKQEWIVVRRDDPSRATAINSTFGIDPSSVVFAGEASRLLFVQTDDIVRRINLDDQTLSRPLASNVANFSGYDEKTIAFVSLPNDNSERVVGYSTTDLSRQQTLATFPADDTPLHIVMAEYFNRRYVSVVHGTTLMIDYGRLPQGNDKGEVKRFATQTVPEGITRLTASENGRFITMEMPGGYAVYDLELMKFDKTAWAKPSSNQRPLQWLDEYMIWSDNEGQLRFYDFDGANQQVIMPVAEGLAATVSPNDKFVYGIAKTDKGFSFNRVRLVQ